MYTVERKARTGTYQGVRLIDKCQSCTPGGGISIFAPNAYATPAVYFCLGPGEKTWPKEMVFRYEQNRCQISRTGDMRQLKAGLHA